MVDVVIIGAGLTGISVAYHLEQNGFFNYVLLEKDATMGGLCRSVVQDGFTFDYTGHLLHINDPYFQDLIAKVVGLKEFNAINRRSFIFAEDTFTKYPYQINLYGRSVPTIVECIKGYCERKKIKQPRNFRDWVLTHFGEGFGKHFFFDYQEKIFDFPIDKLSASWTGRFVPATSLEKIITGSLSDYPEEVGYNAQFLYPKKEGIYYWLYKLAQKLQKPVLTSQEVTRVHPTERVITLKDGSTMHYRALVSTIPLKQLLEKYKDPSASTLSAQARHLKCNSVINFNLGINRPDLTTKHWIYYPEKKFPFYRIGFPHNFSERMAPPLCSSLYGEIACFKRSAQEQHELLRAALSITKEHLNLSDEEIMTEKIMFIEHAYVIYDRWRDRHITPLLQALKEQHIHSVGRYGAWKYSSMQEGILDGKACAEEILATLHHPLYPSLTQEFIL